MKTRLQRVPFGRPQKRRGATVVLAAVIMLVLLAILAFSIDIGYICLERARCQNAADSASHAAACRLLTDPEALTESREVAIAYAEKNMPNAGAVLKAADVEFGIWDRDDRTYTVDSDSPNAVRVVIRRSEDNDNPLPLFFAPLIGHQFADVTAEAITIIPDSGDPQFRFLIDDEMIDSDVGAIEDLADILGMSSDDLISDGNSDGFIDLPAGITLELPTGQVGDEALFDRTSYEEAFPFTSDSDYTMLDFLAEGTVLKSQLGTQGLQDVEWNSANAPHPELVGKKLLDPVPGVDPMSSHSAILDLPNPDVIHLSPVSKSDVAMAETNPSKYGSPAANLQGERRGLLAFKITSARPNPIGGSYLPLITIEVVDPSTIDLTQLTSSGTSSPAAVQIVR
jgi:Flp pilus assembly protein TadG